MSQNVSNPQQAIDVLKQNGVNAGFLQKVQGYLNNPMAGMMAKMAGVNLDSIKSAVTALQGGATPPVNLPNNTPIANNDKMAMLKQGLQQLKR